MTSYGGSSGVEEDAITVIRERVPEEDRKLVFDKSGYFDERSTRIDRSSGSLDTKAKGKGSAIATGPAEVILDSPLWFSPRLDRIERRVACLQKRN